MNPYEAPQTVDAAVQEPQPPRRSWSWRQFALLCLVIAGTQLVMHYVRQQERERKQAERMQQIQRQLQSMPFQETP